ncbi:MAG TPA: purine-nucleoside phosphorylase, partial [Gemmataceae bacterium]|nr:purine-nucleoside phosphorylase [Gemmataceae bacterium]
MQLHNYVDFARATQQKPPRVAIVLGSGLAGVARRLERPRSISFAELPGVKPTSVAGHTGHLFAGEWAGRPVLIFRGRLHFYEGCTWDQVIAPMALTASLGARLLVLTNAAGGIHDALGPGSLMGIRDHI